MSQHEIHSATHGPLGTVRFDHSSRHNCFTESALNDLVDALERSAADPAVNAIHLTMAGPTFCSGWDTREFAALAQRSPADLEASLRATDRALNRITSLPVPVIAAVRGQVTGFGVGLLASLHLAVVADDATAALPEIAYGISPAGVLGTLLRQLPSAAAHRMLLSGLPVAASELHAWGLVAQLAPANEVDAVAAELAHHLTRFPGAVTRTVLGAIQACHASGTSDPAYAAAVQTLGTIGEGGTR
ncbi:enoyl-CoA hydratase/isomerase family protein [Nocardioides sp. Bht2]|uniref:enoyl-CoA hydratase/isomerase family protein n=1 Tax=Nocardioides sp. Bht2 TaxID=3392297 RepID=UPI0039B5EF7A